MGPRGPKFLPGGVDGSQGARISVGGVGKSQGDRISAGDLGRSQVARISAGAWAGSKRPDFLKGDVGRSQGARISAEMCGRVPGGPNYRRGARGVPGARISTVQLGGFQGTQIFAGSEGVSEGPNFRRGRG